MRERLERNFPSSFGDERSPAEAGNGVDILFAEPLKGGTGNDDGTRRNTTRCFPCSVSFVFFYPFLSVRDRGDPTNKRKGRNGTRHTNAKIHEYTRTHTGRLNGSTREDRSCIGIIINNNNNVHP